MSAEAGLPSKGWIGAPLEIQIVRDDGELHYLRGLIFDVMEGQSDGGLALGSISWWRWAVFIFFVMLASLSFASRHPLRLCRLLHFICSLALRLSRRTYQLTLTSIFDFMALNVRQRVFHALTVVEVIEQVFKEYQAESYEGWMNMRFKMMIDGTVELTKRSTRQHFMVYME